MRKSVRVKSYARRLRRELTLPELMLWLRLKQPADGVPRFRRQHPIGPYVLDFYCPAARLGIEVDGMVHSMGDRPERDLARDAWLNAQGVEVLRIEASDVLADPDGVADGVVRQVLGMVGRRSSKTGDRG